MIESAELKDGLIIVKAVNAQSEPARVYHVSLREIYPEPKVKRLGIFALEKRGEKLPCKWWFQDSTLRTPGSSWRYGLSL